MLVRRLLIEIRFFVFICVVCFCASVLFAYISCLVHFAVVLFGRFAVAFGL